MKLTLALAIFYFNFTVFAGDTTIKERGLTQDEVDRLYEIVGVTHEIFVKYSIQYKIEGGTSLGAERDGGLIPWDDDADFDVLEEDLDKIKSLAFEFEKFGMEIIEIPGWGLQICYKDSPELALTDWNGKKSKKPFLDLIAIKSMQVIKYKKAVNSLRVQIEQERKLGNVNLNSKLKYLDDDFNKILKRFSDDDYIYALSQDTAFHDYPCYYLTNQEWMSVPVLVNFGTLKVYAFDDPKDYLDRNYDGWQNKIEILMDHDSNEYFERPLTANYTVKNHKKHSNPAKLGSLIKAVK